jgi:methionine-rich copper-binding protein CopC
MNFVKITLLAIVVLLCSSVLPAQSSAHTLITSAYLFDGETVLTNQAVLIRGDKILSVGRLSELELPEEYERLDFPTAP